MKLLKRESLILIQDILKVEVYFFGADYRKETIVEADERLR